MEIKHNTSQHKFFVIIDGQECYMEYQVVSKKTLDYKSTFVPPFLRGRNIASEIVKVALEYARNNHYQVIPSCSFVATYIARHPQYQFLVT